MSQRIGLLGGSFDPIHHGHLIVARAVLERLGLERIVFLPSAQPPHKLAAALAPPEHRAQMVRLAIVSEPGFEFSDHDLARPGPTYTIETVRDFRRSLGPAADLCFVIGADSLNELPTWREATALVDECRIVTAVRPASTRIDWDLLLAAFGANRVDRLRKDVLETPAIHISATDIRRRVRDGLSIRYLVPEAVMAHILGEGLYRQTGDAAEH